MEALWMVESSLGVEGDVLGELRARGNPGVVEEILLGGRRMCWGSG